MRNYTAKIDAMQNMFHNKLKLEFGMFGSLKENRYVNDYQKTFYSAASYNPTFPNFKNPETGMWDENANANEVQNPLGRLDIMTAKLMLLSIQMPALHGALIMI